MVYRLGAVSFLNSRPLVEGLTERPDVRIVYDVPAALPQRLERGDVDAALVPLIDVIRSAGRFAVVSDACIACDGETMTVRVFSQVPPDRIGTLYVDGDSHTSVALAAVLWRELFDRRLELRRLEPGPEAAETCESVLLIGDKVVRSHARHGFAYEIDLGAAWRQHTGLPFVFAVWAAKGNSEWRMANGELQSGGESVLAADDSRLAALLASARDRGVERAAEIAETEGPKRWWPAALARRYLTHCLKFRLDARCLEGASLFARLCARYGLVPAEADIAWPVELAGTRIDAAGRAECLTDEPA